ncbi:MAG: arsenate reductase (glutaredoxin) [Cytophagaceae bacterium]|nr:arsenate reductase (glutaredoxin) [Cytophagaceae bacterium]
MSIKYTIYHNPRCRKSRETLELLQHNCKEVQIIDYLKTPPSEKELKSILSKLQLSAEELVRKGEAVYKEKYLDKKMTEDQWIQAMVKNPILIERPIVLAGNKAIIGRPPENVLTLV